MSKRSRSCDQCGESFELWPSEERRGRRYCSKSCARTAANLTDRNPALHRDIRGEKNPMWGKIPAYTPFGGRGSAAPRWAGGRKVRRDGYVLVWTPDGYVLEHRMVMESKLGRKLERSEVVHHLDHNPGNNDPANLVVLASQSEHASLHAQA